MDARRQRPLLGTFVEIGASLPPDAAGDRTQRAHAAIDAAFAVIDDVERLLSFHRADSELSRLNREGRHGVVLLPLAARVLRLAVLLGKASDDRFNCTVGGALVRCGRLPEHPHGEFLDSGSWRDIAMNGRHVRLRRPLRITLDGIAKGYAVDLAVRTLQRAGVVAGWVNAGGDLRAFGDLVLPVERRGADGTRQLLGGLRDAAIATSRAAGTPDPDYPGCIWPLAGAGAAHPGVWSVIARRAWRADALTKVAALSDDSGRGALIARLGGILVAPDAPAVPESC